MGGDLLNGKNNWWEAREFSFIRIPKVLFENDSYRALSASAKMLYGLLLDRMGLSALNGWADGNGEVFIYYTLSEAAEILRCGTDKVLKNLRELEGAGLIRRVRQGLCKPDRIYVLPFAADCDYSEVRKSENPKSGNGKNRTPDAEKSESNNTDIINNNIINNYPSIPGWDADEMEKLIKENIEYDILSQRIQGETLDEIVLLITDTLCGTSPTVRIGGSDLSREAVRSRLLMLNEEHIEYVLDCMKESSANVRNIRAYMLTALYNAPATMDSYYSARVLRDMPELK